MHIPYRNLPACPDGPLPARRWTRRLRSRTLGSGAAGTPGGDYGGLPVLADALEEAGCTDTDLLAHCRSGGGHLRGCWAVDLLLGKG